MQNFRSLKIHKISTKFVLTKTGTYAQGPNNSGPNQMVQNGNDMQNAYYNYDTYNQFMGSNQNNFEKNPEHTWDKFKAKPEENNFKKDNPIKVEEQQIAFAEKVKETVLKEEEFFVDKGTVKLYNPLP